MPASRPASSAGTAAYPAMAQAHRWGRVDEDGTVYVRVGDGERPVGSYPGASAEEALAYFARKYDELRAQVDLLEQRMRARGLEAKEAAAGISRLRDAVGEAKAVGDLDGLGRQLDGLDALLAQRRAAAEAERAAARQAARESKERLVDEAESLAESTSWKATGERLRELLEEWKAAPRLDRPSDDALWKRFSAARSTFDKRRRTHFAAVDAQRGEVRERKEALIAEAEELAGSTDWASTTQRYRDLMQQWKSAGRASRDTDDELWNRFRAAQDRFFAARSEVFAERDAGLRGNLEQKEALATEAEAIVPVTNLRAARTALRSVQERWEAVGHVPREARDRVERRLRRVEDAVRDAEQQQWRRANPEARRRAEQTAAQLRASIEQLDRQAERARSEGRDRQAQEAEAAAAARREWLAGAERTLADLS